MKYDHRVKVNGKYYQAGEEVPDVEERGRRGTSPNKNTKPSTKQERKYSKEEINRMAQTE